MGIRLQTLPAFCRLARRVGPMKNSRSGKLVSMQKHKNPKSTLRQRVELPCGIAAGALVLLGVLAPLSSHAEVDAIVREAVALTESSKAKEAFDLLDPKEASRAGDPDFDLVFGVAANQAGQYNRAIFALERVLVTQPGNARARAELGRALFAVGDNKGARTLLNETKEQGVPVEVAKTIDQFLQAIDRVDESGRSSVKGYIEAGIGNDSNVSGGPTSNIVAVPLLGGALVTLAPGGSRTAANYTTLGAGISGRYVIDTRLSLIGSGTSNFRWNGDPASAFNSVQMDVSGGASYRVDRNEFSAVVQTGSYDVGGSRARNQIGLVGEWVYRFDGFRQISTYAQISKLTYGAPQSLRDAQRSVFGSNYAHLFRDGLIVYGGLYFGSEDQFSAANPELGHKLTGVRAGVQKPFSDSLAAFATFGYEERRFGGVDPFFLVKREDRQTNLNVGLSWVPAKGWRVTPLIAYTQTASNVAINQFDALQVSVTARREF